MKVVSAKANRFSLELVDVSQKNSIKFKYSLGEFAKQIQTNF